MIKRLQKISTGRLPGYYSALGRGHSSDISIRPARESAICGSRSTLAEAVRRKRPGVPCLSTSALIARNRPGARFTSSRQTSSDAPKRQAVRGQHGGSIQSEQCTSGRRVRTDILLPIWRAPLINTAGPHAGVSGQTSRWYADTLV